MSDFLYLFGPESYSIEDAVWQSARDYGIKVKIGYTGDPKNCLASLRRGRPEYCFWEVLWFPGKAQSLERELHHFYRRFRTGGEFFAIPTVDAQWLGSLKRGDLDDNAGRSLWPFLCESHALFYQGVGWSSWDANLHSVTADQSVAAPNWTVNTPEGREPLNAALEKLPFT